MPYRIAKVKGGEVVKSPNHPQGFSKKPQSHEKAAAQMRAIQANTHEGDGKAKKIGIKSPKKGAGSTKASGQIY